MTPDDLIEQAALLTYDSDEWKDLPEALRQSFREFAGPIIALVLKAAADRFPGDQLGMQMIRARILSLSPESRTPGGSGTADGGRG